MKNTITVAERNGEYHNAALRTITIVDRVRGYYNGLLRYTSERQAFKQTQYHFYLNGETLRDILSGANDAAYAVEMI